MALLVGYFTATFAWIVWGVATAGDYFAGGRSILVGLSLALAGLIGLFVGWRATGRLARATIVALAVLATSFWFLARNGWWAKSPPPPAENLGQLSGLRQVPENPSHTRALPDVLHVG